MELHGGKVGLESVEGQGSTFFFEIPLIKGDVDSFQDASRRCQLSQVITPLASVSARKTMLVLLVDDSALNRKMMNRLMVSKGHTCTEAEDGIDAVKLMSTGVVHFDLILMDNVMPNMSGPLATKAIRSLGFKGLIFGVTGNALPEDIAKFIAHGADAVLLKPLDVLKFDSVLAEFSLLGR